MKKFQRSQVLSISIAASLVVLLAGCGKADKVDDPSGTGSGQVNPTPAPGTNPPGGSTWCLNGSVDTVNGLWRCTRTVLDPFNAQFLLPYGFADLNTMPRVIPPATLTSTGSMRNQFSYPAPGSNFQVKNKDRLVFMAYGTWDHDFGWINGCDSGPYDLDLSGYDGGTPNYGGVQPVTGEALPLGFMAKVGNRYYPLGSYFDDYVTTNGTLFYGFNTPWNENCVQMSLSFFQHQHCETSAGVTEHCPI
jgi:hypothetical protein